jgi:hypothetical protein
VPTTNFTVQVTDSTGATATAPLSITVNPALSVTTPALSNGTSGVPYSAAETAAGGTLPYTWAVTAGALPPGLSLAAATGKITGTPSVTATTAYNFTVQVTDNVAGTASAAQVITVSAVAPSAVVHGPAVPGRGQPGTFTPGKQGTVQPINPLGTTAVPAAAAPGTFAPADPGALPLSPPPPVPVAFTPAVPGQPQPGTFSPGDPGPPVASGGAPFLVQQVTKTETYNYGWSAAEFSNAAGNMLVVIAGWDLNATAPQVPMPAAYVCDSAANYWYHAGTSAASNTGSRCCIWVAPNAQTVSWVSCSLTGFASSFTYTILEIGNAPQFFSVDAQAVNSAAAGVTLLASPGPAGSADIGFTVLTAGSATASLTATPSGWTALAQAQAGAGQPNAVTVWPFWNPQVANGANLPVNYAVLDNAPLSAVTVLIEAAPYPPVQPLATFPVLKVEAAFGFTPGDLSQSPPAWTDITARCAAKDGTPFIQASMGRSYELGQPETGELTISCSNQDGAFTPGNVNSPFYPNVVLKVPVRVSAFWGGTWYYVAFGYVERWPQTWPDMPGWGMSALVATDAFGILSSARAYSALAGDLLLDVPYLLIPCSDQYTTQQNSLIEAITPSECQGLLAANIARGNQRTGTYVDGTGAQCATGQSNTLLGTQDTAFGCTSFTAPLTAASSGPGMVYADPGLPSPNNAQSVTAEFWLTITAAAAAANLQPTVFTAFSAASNYQTARPAVQVQVQNVTGNNQLQVTFATGISLAVPFTPGPSPQQVVLVFAALGSSGASAVTVYVNGAVAGTQILTAAQLGGAWQALMLGCGNYAYHNGNLTGGVFTASDLAVYPYALPLQRVASHYVTGVSGQQNADAPARIAQVLSWAGLGIPRGGQVTFGGITPGILQGPAYSLAGANVSASVGQVAVNEQGMAFCSPDGTLQFAHRWALFNQGPAAVFGDSDVLGEIPFQPGQSFDYDDSHLANVDQVQQTRGPVTGITVTGTDTGSQASYFTRSAPQFGIQTMSALDAYDTANWAISVYSQPQLRERGLTVDAAASPQAAFPAVLALGQGGAAVVNRRPPGGAAISAPVIVQKITHDIGPMMWNTSYEMSPYPPLGTVLQLDQPAFGVIGSNTLP